MNFIWKRLSFLRNMASSSTASEALRQLHKLFRFDNKALRVLPVDTEPNRVRLVRNAIFSRVQPTPVLSPVLVVHAKEVFELLGVEEEVIERNLVELAEYLSGNRLWEGSESAAHCYCGHQFGSFAGQLGDGAAMYLGEVINDEGQRWEIQLKGAGLTPYSRQADGRKVLRSSLREFLCSEAMHHLGVPTTRCASCVTSDTLVDRDVFYNGNVKQERASVVMRVAQTFIRFGSFEICKATDESTGRSGPSAGNSDIIRVLLDYVIENFYPEIWKNGGTTDATRQAMYVSFYGEVVRRTAQLVAKWQCVGFCHGVLNTDNMSVLGVTIDYGPFGFMDRYDPHHICNASDRGGRYAYAAQPSMCRWNCAKLAEALAGVVAPGAALSAELDRVYDGAYSEAYLSGMRDKLGLLPPAAGDEVLIKSLLETMEGTGADFTNTFLCLEAIAADPTNHQPSPHLLDPLIDQCCTVGELRKANQPVTSQMERQLLWTIAGNNRDLLVQMGGEVILEDERKLQLLAEMKDWTESTKRERDRASWTRWLATYLTRLAPDATPDLTHRRLERMRGANPRQVLRNYLAEEAIRAAEAGDYKPAVNLLDQLRRPYGLPGDLAAGVNRDLSPAPACSVDKELDEAGASAQAPASSTRRPCRPPAWAGSLQVT